jgi:uncharacterized membrane protein
MAIRIVTRLLLLLIALAAATTLIVGGMAALASTAPAAGSVLQRDQVAEVRKNIDTSTRDAADAAPGAAPTPAVVLVFAGIVLMAALPPVYGVHVYQRTYHQRF